MSGLTPSVGYIWATSGKHVREFTEKYCVSHVLPNLYVFSALSPLMCSSAGVHLLPTAGNQEAEVCKSSGHS